MIRFAVSMKLFLGDGEKWERQVSNKIETWFKQTWSQ